MGRAELDLFQRIDRREPHEHARLARSSGTASRVLGDAGHEDLVLEDSEAARRLVEGETVRAAVFKVVTNQRFVRLSSLNFAPLERKVQTRMFAITAIAAVTARTISRSA